MQATVPCRAGARVGRSRREISEVIRQKPLRGFRPTRTARLNSIVRYRRYSDFTAQSFNVEALLRLYGELERKEVAQPNLTPFVVFLAFSIESYLNSLGARNLEIWDELERLPWKNKVKILHKVAGCKADWSRAPLQFASEVFKLRDKLAHGKPEQVVGPWVDEGEDLGANVLVPVWYRGITKEWVLEAKERFRLLMTYLGNLFALHESDHLMLSSGGVHRDDEPP